MRNYPSLDAGWCFFFFSDSYNYGKGKPWLLHSAVLELYVNKGTITREIEWDGQIL